MKKRAICIVGVVRYLGNTRLKLPRHRHHDVPFQGLHLSGELILNDYASSSCIA